MKYILLALLTMIFIGCSTKVPVVTKYKINIPSHSIQTEISSNSKCKKQSLKVLQSFSSSILMSSEMHYVLDANKIYPYSAAGWASTPNRSISDEYFMMLRDLKFFNAVQSAKSRTKASWLLEIKVEDFMQYYEKDNTKSFAKVSIDLTLLNANGSDVIASRNFHSKVNTRSLDAQGGVIALDNALADVLSQSALWISEECK